MFPEIYSIYGIFHSFASKLPLQLTSIWKYSMGLVSGHKRRKHVFRTSEVLQSAEINTESSFSIHETGVKLTAAEHFLSSSYNEIAALFVGPISDQWAQFPDTNEEARLSTQIKLKLLHVTLNDFHSLILIKL